VSITRVMPSRFDGVARAFLRGLGRVFDTPRAPYLGLGIGSAPWTQRAAVLSAAIARNSLFGIKNDFAHVGMRTAVTSQGICWAWIDHDLFHARLTSDKPANYSGAEIETLCHSGLAAGRVCCQMRGSIRDLWAVRLVTMNFISARAHVLHAPGSINAPHPRMCGAQYLARHALG
jgi:hypothetical protein